MLNWKTIVSAPSNRLLFLSILKRFNWWTRLFFSLSVVFLNVFFFFCRRVSSLFDPVREKEPKILILWLCFTAKVFSISISESEKMACMPQALTATVKKLSNLCHKWLNFIAVIRWLLVIRQIKSNSKAAHKTCDWKTLSSLWQIQKSESALVEV